MKSYYKQAIENLKMLIKKGMSLIGQSLFNENN